MFGPDYWDESIIEMRWVKCVNPMFPFRTKILICPLARSCWLLKAQGWDLLRKLPHSRGSASSTLCLFSRSHPRSMTGLCWGVKAHLPFLSLGQPWNVIALLQLSIKSAEDFFLTTPQYKLFPLHDLISSLPCTCGSKELFPANLVHANPCFQAVSWVTWPKRV